MIIRGVPEDDYAGIDGFFARLEKNKHKVQNRVFISRFKSASVCQSCDGTRLRREALAVRIGGRSIADLCDMKVEDAVAFFDELPLTDH